jgi:hypothetical protein
LVKRPGIKAGALFYAAGRTGEILSVSINALTAKHTKDAKGNQQRGKGGKLSPSAWD